MSTVVLLLVALLVPPASADRDGVWSILDIGATRPAARRHHTMIYDPGYDRVILYGGETMSGGSPVALNDLWALDLSGACGTWTQLSLTGGPTEGRHGHSAAFDPEHSLMYIVFGRTDFGDKQNPEYSRETWVLDLNSQTPAWLSGKAFPTGTFTLCTGVTGTKEARSHSVAGYLPEPGGGNDGSLFIMGGMAGPTANSNGTPVLKSVQDTWELVGGYDGAWAHRWGDTQPGDVIPPYCFGAPPVRRLWHSIITDELNSRLVVYGGWYPEAFDDNFSDAWSTDGSLDSNNRVTWTLLGNGPSARTFHSAVYDDGESGNERMIVLGGYTAPGRPSDVGSSITDLAISLDLNSTDWDTLATSGNGPGPIAQHAAVYDSQNDRMIVFGGVNGSGAFISDNTYILEFTDETAPAAVTLSAGQIGRTSSTITWTAPGDDGTCGTATSYDLRRSTSVINESNFSSATPVGTDTPSIAGSGECATSHGLTPCQTYFYALKTTDERGNASPLSNVISIKQKCSGVSYICDGGGLGPVSAPAVPQMVEYAIRGANPASGVTTLFVGIPTDRQGEAMEISIFDVTGARIRTLTEGAAAAGEREFTWDHRANNGAAVAGGVYFARLQLGNETRTHKIVVSTGR